MFSLKKLFYVLGFIFILSCQAKNGRKTEHKPKRVVSNKILIILGKDYYQRSEILNYFEKDYGLNTTASKIELLKYDEMLTRSGNVILRSISEAIEKSDCDIVIALGVPEGSGRYLLQSREKFPEKVYISLLPMEDTLRLEATCDIVVDFKLPDNLMNEEEAFSVSNRELELLLVASVFAGEDILANKKSLSFSPYEEFNRAFFIAYSVLFANDISAYNFRVSPYVDPTTSIPSRKYFIVYEKKDEEVITN